MADSVVIAHRFHGPPASGNGGYVCGLAARFIDGPAEVTLRAPPPLDTPLDVVREGDAVVLRDGDVEIARATPSAPNVTPPFPPSFEEADAARALYRGRDEHIFPTCFVCGHARAEGEGLRLFPGAVAGRDLVAASWTLTPDLADDDGLIAPEFLWAALDCPSYWALPNAGALPAVLGRLTAAIDARPAPGAPLVVAAWPRGADGRKHYSASAIYDAEGRVCARAEAVWIALKPNPGAPP